MTAPDEAIENGPQGRLDGPLYDLQKEAVRKGLFGGKTKESRIGRFVIRGKLGQGGMGTVLEAYDETLDRPVAIKLVREKLQAEYGERLRREAQALAKLSHPNVVHVYETGTVEGQTFIVMELVRGVTLEHWQRQPHAWHDCLDAYLQAGRGLAAAHASGLVHRDFKPGNCIIDAERHVRVLDFGLAGALNDGQDHIGPATTHGSGRGAIDRTDTAVRESETAAASSASPERLTEPGALLGTQAYMAPEQLYPRISDARSDQFSFCVAFYEGLHGQHPFSDDPGPILLDMAEGASHLPLPPPRGSKVPRWLQRIVGRGLSARPAARWPSMNALLDEIERRRRRAHVYGASWVGGGLACVALMSISELLRSSAAPCKDVQHDLDGIWDQAQRQKIGDTIASMEHPRAVHTSTVVLRELDRYAATWMDSSEQACRATLAHHEQSTDALALRRRCLFQRRTALRHSVEFLATRDIRLVDEAVELVTGLPSVEPCNDPEALARQTEALSPEVEDHATVLWAELERIRTFDLVGLHTDALTAVEPLLQRARELEHPRLLAEVLQVAGQLHVNVGEHEKAAERFHEAHVTALPHEAAIEPAVRAMAGLIHIIGVEHAKPDTAMLLGTLTEGLAQRPEVAPPVRAEVLIAVAQVQTESGEHAEAQRLYEQAIAILEEQRGEGHIAVVEALDGWATAAHRQGFAEAAEQSYRRALAIREHWLGPDHPAVAYLLVNLVAVLVEDPGRRAEALELCLRAARILDGAPRPEPKRLAHAHTNLGSVLSKLGQQGEAEKQLRSAIHKWNEAGQAGHPRVAIAHYNLARILEKQERVVAAIEECRLALQILEGVESTPQTDDLKSKVRARIDRLLREQAVDGSSSGPSREL